MNNKALNVLTQLITQRTKAARPAYSVQQSKAKSAAELGKLIGDSWLGYGLVEDSEKQTGDIYKVGIKTDLKKFDDAMRFLWYKSQGDETHKTYTMMGLPYTVDVTVNGKILNVAISPKTATQPVV